MPSDDFDVVVAGHICLDITPKFDGIAGHDIKVFLQPGKLHKVGDAVLSTGGAVSNTGIALSKLGYKVSYMSSVGRDGFGELIIKIMSKYGSVDGFFQNNEIGSSYSVILVIPPEDRIILHSSGCNNYFTSENIRWEIVSSARLFHLGYPSIMQSLFRDDGLELANILKKVKLMGVSTSVDMALTDPDSEAGRIHWHAWFRNVLPHVDFFMPSIEEMLLFLDRKQWQTVREESDDFVEGVPLSVYHEVSQKLLGFGCNAVFLKAGQRGMYLKTAAEDRIREVRVLKKNNVKAWSNRELWGAAYEVENIQSATGAGDSAAAGILAALLRGKSAEETLRWGNCLGYQNLRALDTVSGIGTYGETKALLANLKPVTLDFLEKSWRPTYSIDVWEKIRHIVK